MIDIIKRYVITLHKLVKREDKMIRIFTNKRQIFTQKKQGFTLDRIKANFDKHGIYVIMACIVYCLILGTICFVVF